MAINLYKDKEIDILKSELHELELLLGELTNENLELEKLLSEFQHRHTHELGDIILELLNLRKLKFKDDKERYEETENDERQYREQVIAEKSRKFCELTLEQKITLKKNFRKATLLCHPDKVSNEFKSDAETIFIKLKTAYELNDLKKVTDILKNLQKGSFKTQSETLSEKDLLILAIKKLQSQIDSLKTEIKGIRQSETYEAIIEIDNWDDYFLKTKTELQRELHNLKEEIKNGLQQSI